VAVVLSGWVERDGEWSWVEDDPSYIPLPKTSSVSTTPSSIFFILELFANIKEFVQLMLTATVSNDKMTATHSEHGSVVVGNRTSKRTCACLLSTPMTSHYVQKGFTVSRNTILAHGAPRTTFATRGSVDAPVRG
jgi:hypothetical protein